MTITDLKSYADRIRRQASPADRFTVTLNREAMTYIGAFLRDRKRSLESALTDPRIKPQKAANRALEYGMVAEALSTIEKAKPL